MRRIKGLPEDLGRPTERITIPETPISPSITARMGIKLMTRDFGIYAKNISQWYDSQVLKGIEPDTEKNIELIKNIENQIWGPIIELGTRREKILLANLRRMLDYGRELRRKRGMARMLTSLEERGDVVEYRRKQEARGRVRRPNIVNQYGASLSR